MCAHSPAVFVLIADLAQLHLAAYDWRLSYGNLEGALPSLFLCMSDPARSSRQVLFATEVAHRAQQAGLGQGVPVDAS